MLECGAQAGACTQLGGNSQMRQPEAQP
jgi:hypothetical protein